MQFNETQKTVEERTRTTNKAGGEAFEPLSSELELYLNTINNLLEDTYYESDQEAFDRLYSVFADVAEENPEFALQLAYYAREEMYLRQVPQALLVFAANHDAYTDTGLVRKYATGIMQRADEPLEALALHVDRHGRTIPHSLKMGIEDALHQWDEYQFAKYDQRRRDWRYRDLMALVHPNPRDEEREEIFEKIVHGDLSEYDAEPLKQHGTWEDKMSESGQSDEQDKAEAYRERLDRMPLKATVMQTRDILNAGLEPEEILTDDLLNRVSDGKLWPFRYYRAYKALTNAGYHSAHIDRWFEGAIDASVETVPDQLGDTYTTVDLSGSMNTPLSENANTTYKQISALFGAICAKKGAKVSGFASDFKEFDFHVDTPALQAVKEIEDARIGMSTNAGQVIRHLWTEGREYENVAIFTDMQIWAGRHSVKDAWDGYTRDVAPDANLYIIDLSSYGDLVMPEGYNNVFRVSGWNSNVVKHIKYANQEDEAIRTVENMSPP